MDTSRHALSTLLEQLGVPADRTSVEAFLESHRLEQGKGLADAPFWSDSHAAFLREAFEDDSDWCFPVDELAARLQH